MSRNIETMIRFVEAQNNHDSAAVVACFAPDFKRRSAETGWQEMGADNYADMSDRYWAAFPDTHFEIQHLMEDGNFIFLQYMETGTWTGTWEMPGGISIPPHNTITLNNFGEKGFPWTQVDCGIAVENIALAAEGLGIGSVILGLPKLAFTGDKADALRTKLQCPEGYDFVIAIALGYSKDMKESHDLREEKISRIG